MNGWAEQPEAASPAASGASRRRPVPRAWREAHHRLSVRSRVAGGSPIRGGGNVYRARGRCSCGVEFNPERKADGSLRYANDMTRAGVIEAWRDHVEEAYYLVPRVSPAEVPAGLKVYRAVVMAPRRLGLPDRQAEVLVAAKSWAAASRATEAAGLGRLHHDFASITSNLDNISVAAAQPGIVFGRGLDSHGAWQAVGVAG